MKRIILPIVVSLLGIYTQGYAQLISGKYPTSLTNSEMVVPYKTIEVEPLKKEQLIKDLQETDPHGTMVASLKETSVSFPEDGTLITSDDGMRVWRVRIHMPNSLGLGLYFDKYQLPEGVEMFIYNENKKHIKGAYSHLENLEDKMFATDPVQGEFAYVELNIQPSVNIDEIEFHINEVASYFRGGLRELTYYADESADTYGTLAEDDELFFRESSVCMINAACPQNVGFENQKKATVHTLIKSGGGIFTCSGTMVNITNNDPDVSCQRYILTASHCEGSNAMDGSPVFSSQYIFRFNYESTTCENPTVAPVANSITGAKFLSRSDYTTEMRSEGGARFIKGDFLLMRLLTPIHHSWDVTLNGYNAGLPRTSVSAPDKFMGFHHPAGDIKKLTVYSSLTNFSLGAPGTHWQVLADEGYIAGGSSGSALFDENGRIIGIASVAVNGHMTPLECLVAADGSSAPRTSRDLKYSKLSYCWTNPGDDGSEHRMLKPWLDPTGENILTTNTVTSSCTPLSTSSNNETQSFDAGFNVYPNPSHDGIIELNISITAPGYYKIEVLDINGRMVQSRTYDNLSSQILKVDLSNVSNGIYMVKLSNQFGSTTQKVVVSK